MSFTKASFQLHSHFQKFINTPYLFNKNQNCLVENPKYSKKSFSQILFRSAIAMFPGLQLIYTIHLAYLFHSWQNDEKSLNLNQVTFCAIYVTIVCIANASNFLLVTRHNESRCHVSETCRLGNGIKYTSNIKIGVFALQEIVIYSMYLGILTV